MDFYFGQLQRLTQFLIGICICGSVLGCAFDGDHQQRGAGRHYFGYVKIEKNAAGPKEISEEKIFFVGAKISNGVELGVSNSRTLSIPLDCRTVILIQNGAQMQEAISTISKIGLNNICVSEY